MRHLSFRLDLATRAASIALLATLAAGAVMAQTPAAEVAEAAGRFDPDAEMPVDANLVRGQLDNGLRYWIRRNDRPENRAELRLVLDAGSILEDPSQRGLAHFVEHMAFNGSRHFEKQELVEYLESIGMRFGPDLNAYTSFDQTVYLLQLPTDDPSILDQAFLILEDWAQGLSLEGEEIDKERGVVIEEWRGRRGAGQRIQEQQQPVLFKGSLYPERLPIGTKEILESFPHEELRRFYRDWYRPDLMAVVVVGDIDPEAIEKKIRKRFGKLRNPPDARERFEAEVPDHGETLVSVVTDPELTRTSVSVAFKRDPAPEGRVRDYRRGLVEGIFTGMLNARLGELTQRPDPPFLGASAGGGRFVRSKDVNMLSAGVEDGGLERGLEALLREAERARRHGFQESELERQKLGLARFYEQAYNERDKTESRVYAAEYIRAFLEDESTPGIVYERDLVLDALPTITVDEVNAVASRFLEDRNRVILVAGPEPSVPGEVLADEETLLAVFDRVADAPLDAWQDEVSDGPLLAAELEPAEIVERREWREIGVAEWRLANGVRVLLKPTTFKNDEVIFTSYSFGGHSLVDDDHWVAASTADSVVAAGGVGQFSLVELGKALSGKVVNVSPYIGELTEGFRGGGSPTDLETLFQLVYLYAKEPRRDESAFESQRSRLAGMVENRELRPETIFGDRLSAILSSDHPRRRPMTLELLDELDLDRSLQVYKDRFADLGDSAFFFVGAFELDEIEPLVRTYLGNLPATGREESFRDVGVEPPTERIVETVYRGIDEKAQVRIVFNGDFEWSRANRYWLGSMAEALNRRLRVSLREDLGGTYGAGAYGSPSQHPRSRFRFTIAFGCDPERVDELVAQVFEDIRRLQEEPVEEELVEQIQETQRRQRETDMKRNSFWLSTLSFYDRSGEDLANVLDLDEWIDRLTPAKVQEAAREYFDLERYVKVVLMPEDRQPGEAGEAAAR
jgi:zinc protease